MACLWFAAPVKPEHVFRPSVGFAPWGVDKSSGTEQVALLPNIWPVWLRERAEEEGVLVPLAGAYDLGGDATAGGSVSCRLLGLVKLTHHGALYFSGPATRWNVEGT